GADEKLAKAMFGDKRVITVTMPGLKEWNDSLAWEVLDGLVVSDRSMFNSLRNFQWQRSGDCWGGWRDVHGPTSSICPEVAKFRSVWPVGTPAPVRAKLMIGAVLAAIVLLAAALLPRRFAMIAVIIASVLTGGGMVLFIRSLPALQQNVGEVQVVGNGQVQVDRWNFVWAREAKTIRFSPVWMPMLAGEGGNEGVGLELVVDERGTTWEARFEKGARLATLSRSFVASASAPLREVSMTPIVRALYLKPGLREDPARAGVVIKENP
ncbi:MAG TPA: hypothetical protein VF669_01655, partial [Tepidisphaeraceae bacterium]